VTPHTGQLLPARYLRPRLIGRGGMGDIYRATDTTLGRAVAVKVLAAHQAEDEEVRGRFLREALAATRLSGQPHTVTIYDVGEWEGRPFIVMEHLAGGSLAEQLAHGRPAPAQALEWLDETAAALDAAHEHGVVHRDVKPANLLLDQAGHVNVADFGIASAAGLDSHTQTGTVLGTAGYLSPEQAAGERATPASDRYALAVVAHELLTGARPGAAAQPLPPAVERVFDQALARDPEARFGSGAELVAALRAALAGIEPPTLVMHRRKRPVVVVAAALAAAGALAALLTATIGAGNSSPPPSPTTTRTLVLTVTAPAPQPTPTVEKDHGERRERHHGKKEKD
jgi:eukaryotic-like serine/threonine-protein kinase